MTVLLQTAAIRPKYLTLAVVRVGERVLLGKKKRGFGEGYYNGFGGKVEANETIAQAAIRELEEESGLKAKNTKWAGMLTFKFDDKPQPWEVHVFEVNEYTGTPTESDEMAPQWFDIENIPFDNMWADDKYWYPLLFRGQCFKGVFDFVDTHTMVTCDIQHLGPDEVCDYINSKIDIGSQ